MILAIKTDKPKAELYLFDGDKKIDELIWQADRKLADELLIKIQELLTKSYTKSQDLTGIVIYTGTGSFTGLRIGTTVANALAYSLSIPIIEATGESWISSGVRLLPTTKLNMYVVPKYSSEPNITYSKPKKP
jgi:tRNA threonylcarbamoyl adenosine modification protein YeaZ